MQDERYAGFVSNHLFAIAQISRYADMLLEAALEDVKNHDGAGHHFRQMALSLKIPFVGPKVASFAWLLLQPMTSQLGTMDRHMTRALGYQSDALKNNRDYFRLERELQAGRDAAGYNHVPLGLFQWMLWDGVRTGVGSHQDHSPLRVIDPQPHHLVDWQGSFVGGATTFWDAPDWWRLTDPYRQQVADQWDSEVAPNYPTTEIPWQDQEVTSSTGDLLLALDIPQAVKKRIANWVSNLDIPAEDLVPPEEYHITLAYASEAKPTNILREHNVSGIKFEGAKLDHLGDHNALVLLLQSDMYPKVAEMIHDHLKRDGINPERHEDWRPHITIAYIDHKPKAPALSLSFRAGSIVRSSKP